jgi:CRP-like cAMP-binding protein
MATPEEVLAKLPLFSMLSKKEVAKLAREAHDRTFPAGAVLTDEKGAGVSFGVIVEGRAAVSVHGRLARTLGPGPGDYFGEIALIDHSTGRRRSRPRRICAACCSSRGSSVPSPCATLRRPGPCWK